MIKGMETQCFPAFSEVQDMEVNKQGVGVSSETKMEFCL
jgi:hypothetical protein